ncbi:DUF4240 domain-containing protein [Micromonospora sp. HM134]|uniref:DUF4240 domain-containing protein n=1 Tax=Micromonospora sp. HM134 TaxID=2583243 RepID=UPI001198B218|nr:DUF4240 domain-containing protein [Micromonospora sp. HM134]QDY11417.1 DUF4240 domain-containing protein [Micromonospora sp. HM134]
MWRRPVERARYWRRNWPTTARWGRVRDAAILLLGSIDDEDFLAARDWILSRGRQTMQRVQDDPDGLVELAPDRHNARIDWFCGLPLEAHIAATGAPFAIDGPSGPGTPLGTPADLTPKPVRGRFPRLTADRDDNPWTERPWERTAGWPPGAFSDECQRNLGRPG